MSKYINPGRAKHMHGVAEYMMENAEKYGLDGPRMYVLGLLHDVGYMFGDDNHELLGSSEMEMLGYIDHDLIRFHGCTPSEYKDFKKCEDEDIPNELVLLWEADMAIEVDGRHVTFDERLQSIKKRRGDKTFKRSLETVDWLYKYANERRLPAYRD